MTLAEAIAIRLFLGYPVFPPPALGEAKRIIEEEAKRAIETYNKNAPTEVSRASHYS